MSDVREFEEFRNRKLKAEKEAAKQDKEGNISKRPKLIYKDINGHWQVVIQGESCPVSQVQLMPDHILERLQMERPDDED